MVIRPSAPLSTLWGCSLILLLLFSCRQAVNPNDGRPEFPPRELGCVQGNCYEGTGQFHYEDGIYIGEWSDGEWHGKGKLRLEGGDYYSGEFVDGSFQGKGHYHCEIQGWEYTGQWMADAFHGQGDYRCPADNTYKGRYVEGQRHGYGVFVYRIPSSITKATAGDRYYGEWQKDDYTGWGILVHEDGSTEAGVWTDGHTLAEAKAVDEVMHYLNTTHRADLDHGHLNAQ